MAGDPDECILLTLLEARAIIIIIIYYYRGKQSWKGGNQGAQPLQVLQSWSGPHPVGMHTAWYGD